MTDFTLAEKTIRDRQPGDTLVLWLPVFLGLGIGLYFLLPFEPSRAVLVTFFVVSAALTIATWRFRGIEAWRWIAAIAVLVTGGLVLMQTRTQAFDTQLVTTRYYNATVSGTISHVEYQKSGWRIMVSPATIKGDKKNYTLRLTLRQRGQEPALGAEIIAKASILPPSAPFIPGMYDFRRHAYFQGISGYGYVTKLLSIKRPETPHQESLLERYRAWLAENVYAHVDQPAAGITTALLNGERSGISRKTTQNLQQSGLQHVISISGLHVGLMAGIVFFLTRALMALNMRLALLWPIKKIAAGVALVSILLYMMIVGQDPATLRSVIMTSIVLLAVMLDREAINLRLVALAAFVILLIRPESALDIGFHLSFAAVTGLVVFYNLTDRFWKRPEWQDYIIMRGIRALLVVLATTMVATLSTAPLVLLHFQQIPMLSALANLLATPFVSFMIMPGTFFTYMLSFSAALMHYPVLFMAWGVKGMIWVSTFIAQMPLSVLRLPALSGVAVVLLMLAALCWIGIRNRFRYIGIVLLVVGLIAASWGRQADVFLTSDRILLVKSPDKNLLYAEGRMDGFQKSMLLQYTGAKKTEPLFCDAEICDLTVNDQRVRVIRTVPALKRACVDVPDVIVTRYYLDKPCRGALVIDRHTLDREGSAALWVGKTTRVETLGKFTRPWEQRPPKPRFKQHWRWRT